MGKVKSGLKSLGRLVGFDSDAIADAGRKQAEATTKAANDSAAAMREQAAQAQRGQETLAAQRQAADSAAALLNSPVQQADVDISSTAEDTNVDPDTGRRRRPRDAYSAASINI